MDVRCDRCQTEYELDESRLTEAGVAVKCTNCGNVFKVRMRTTSMPGLAPVPTLGGISGGIAPPSLSAPQRVWLVRRYDGSTLTLHDLTELQRAVVERKVAPDDGVSVSGGAWHTLGSIPELASFFEVVRTSRGRTSSSSTLGADGPGPGQGRTLTPVWQEGPSALGSVAPRAADPAWVPRPPDADPELEAMLAKEDSRVLKKGRMARWIGGAVVVILVAGGIAIYGVGVPGMSAPGTLPVAPIKPPDVNSPARTPSPDARSPSSPELPSLPPTKVEAAPPVQPAPSGPRVEPKVAPAPAKTEATSPGTVSVAAPAQTAAKKVASASESGGDATAPSGRSFDYYISQGHKLLDSKPSIALSMFEKAADLDPKSPEPDSGKGLAYANLERLSDSATAFQTALHKSTEFTEAILGLAEVSARQGNRRKAMGLYQRYLDLTPDGPDAPAARAQLDELKAEAPAERAAAAPAPPPAVVPATAAAAKSVATEAKRPDVTPPPPVVVPDTAPSAQ